MKYRVTNRHVASAGIHTAGGLVTLQPGETRVLELEEAEAAARINAASRGGRLLVSRYVPEVPPQAEADAKAQTEAEADAEQEAEDEAAKKAKKAKKKGPAPAG